MTMLLTAWLHWCCAGDDQSRQKNNQDAGLRHITFAAADINERLGTN